MTDLQTRVREDECSNGTLELRRAYKMAWTNLPTNYTDATWSGLRRYLMVNNEDETEDFLFEYDKSIYKLLFSYKMLLTF